MSNISLILMLACSYTAYSSDGVGYIHIGEHGTEKMLYHNETDSNGIKFNCSFTCTQWQKKNYKIFEEMHNILNNQNNSKNRSIQDYIELINTLVESTQQFTKDLVDGKYHNIII